MYSSRKFGLALVVSTSLLLCPASGDVRAERTPAARARAHNAAAKKLFTLGQFREAADRYKKAYQAKPIPEFLFNIAQCYKRMGTLRDLQQALFYFESYRNSVKVEQHRQVAEEEIAELKPRMEKLRQQGSRDRPPAEQDGPTAKEIPVDEPGSAQLPVSTARPPRAPDRPFYKTWWFWSLVGVVVVGGTAAIAATTGGDDWVPSGPQGEYSPDTF